jgi:nucleoid-associated protein YgaU
MSWFGWGKKTLFARPQWLDANDPLAESVRDALCLCLYLQHMRYLDTPDGADIAKAIGNVYFFGGEAPAQKVDVPLLGDWKLGWIKQAYDKCGEDSKKEQLVEYVQNNWETLDASSVNWKSWGFTTEYDSKFSESLAAYRLREIGPNVWSWLFRRGFITDDRFVVKIADIASPEVVVSPEEDADELREQDLDAASTPEVVGSPVEDADRETEDLSQAYTPERAASPVEEAELATLTDEPMVPKRERYAATPERVASPESEEDAEEVIQTAENDADTTLSQTRSESYMDREMKRGVCEGGNRAGCYGQFSDSKTACTIHNARTGACNFDKVRVPVTPPDADSAVYSLFLALNIGAQIKLQLRRALSKYASASAAVCLFSSVVLDRHFFPVNTPNLFRNRVNTREIVSQHIFVTNGSIARLRDESPEIQKQAAERFLRLNSARLELDVNGMLIGPVKEDLIALSEDSPTIFEDFYAERFAICPHYQRFVPSSDYVPFDIDTSFTDTHVIVTKLPGFPEKPVIDNSGTSKKPINVFYEITKDGTSRYVPYPLYALFTNTSAITSNTAIVHPGRPSSKFLRSAAGMLRSAAKHLRYGLDLFKSQRMEDDPRAVTFLSQSDLNLLYALDVLSTHLPDILRDIPEDAFDIEAHTSSPNVQYGDNVPQPVALQIVATEVLWSYYHDIKAVDPTMQKIMYAARGTSAVYPAPVSVEATFITVPSIPELNENFLFVRLTRMDRK